MAAAIPALMGAQMVSGLLSSIFQQGNQGSNGFGNPYQNGMRNGALTFGPQGSPREVNITVNNYNPENERISF